MPGLLDMLPLYRCSGFSNRVRTHTGLWIKGRGIRLFSGGLLLLLLVTGCGHQAVKYPRHWEGGPFPGLIKPKPDSTEVMSDDTEVETPTPRSDLLNPILTFARSKIGTRGPLEVDGKRFRFDCSGYVSAAYAAGGLNIMTAEGHSPRGASGTQIIHLYMERHGQLFRTNPMPGDLVFFDNTYDRNGDGKLNDLFSHIGLVNAVLPSGTVELLHLSNHGISTLRMNLEQPTKSHNPQTGERMNDYLRRRVNGEPHGTPHLAREMFRTYGRLLR